MGKWLDTRESINQHTLETFRKAKKFRMDDYIEPEGGWKSFNDFFARHYKEGKRPIAPGEQTIIQPTDATYGGSWPIDSNAEISIKKVPWPIKELLAGRHEAPCSRSRKCMLIFAAANMQTSSGGGPLPIPS